MTKRGRIILTEDWRATHLLSRYYASRRPPVLISPTEWVLVLALAVSSFDPYVLQSDAELVLGVHDLFARYRHPDSE